jgi:uncharacterized protein
MLITLLMTAFWMGVAGGPHCMAMCGAACAGLQGRSGQAPWSFHLGRLFSYAALGAVAAGSMQLLGWLSLQTSALRPFWVMLNVLAFGLGGLLLAYGKQPLALEQAARQVWRRMKPAQALSAISFSASSTTLTVAPNPTPRPAAPGFALGVAWAFMPCSLLYSAALVAGLSGQVLWGALIMLAFALGSALFLLAAPWLWRRLALHPKLGQAGVRLSGAALMLSAGWGLWMSLFDKNGLWCVS